MKKFIYIFKIIKLFVSTKKIFSTPNNKQIIIFDNYNSRDQVKKIFKKDKFAEILCPSENYDLEYIYVSFEILIFSIAEILKGNIKYFYYIALIRIINPKVIITFSQKNFSFFRIAKKLEKKYKFLVIQNAHLSLFDLKRDDLEKIYVPEYYCLSQYYVDYFKSLKINIKKYTIIGSLHLSLFEENVKKNFFLINKRKETYICVVAGNLPILKDFNDNSHDIKTLYERTKRLWLLLDKFSRKHKIYFKLASRYSRDFLHSPGKKNSFDNEENLFKKIFKNNKYFEKIDRDKKNFSSYKLALNSKLIIGFHSTLLLECLAKNKKILCLNELHSYENYINIPIMHDDNISAISNYSYEILEERILTLYHLSLKKYSDLMFYKKKYMIFYDKKTPTKKLFLNKINNILLESNNKI